MNTYLIRPIPLCAGVRNKSQLVYRNNPGEKVEICCYVWYIQGGDARILIDTGTSAEYYHSVGVTQQKHIQYLEEGLNKYGVKPEEIDIVILTHLHADHVEQARRFTRAKFIIQEEEIRATKHPAMATEYISSMYEGLDFKVINGDTRITDGVKALFTPGHTPGTQSVAVQTDKGIAVISGFCSIGDNFTGTAKDRPVSAPGVFTNFLQAYDSVIKVKQIADIVIPLHDMKYTQVDTIA